MSNFSNIRIILCAHGDRASRENRTKNFSADDNLNLKRIAKYIDDNLSAQICKIVLLSESGSLERALKETSKELTIIVPMIFSDGYFYSIIEAAVKSQSQINPFAYFKVLPPLCDWPELAACIAKLVCGGPVMSVAHGSQRSDASRLANERLVKQLEQNYNLDVSCAYLEEKPFAHEEIGLADIALNIVGLFLGGGLHGAEDWEMAVSAAKIEPRVAFTVGSMEQLPALVCDQVKLAIDTLNPANSPNS